MVAYCITTNGTRIKDLNSDAVEFSLNRSNRWKIGEDMKQFEGRKTHTWPPLLISSSP